ncbi:Long-chain-fatty-acid--CoA ligase ACSBG2 [Anthophora plagiata]
MVILLFKDNMTAVQPIQSNGIIKGFTIDEKEKTDKDFYDALCSETGLDGPDQILPTDTYSSTKLDGRVRIRLRKEDNDSSLPVSVPGLLSRIAKNYPDHVAIISRPDITGERKTYTYKDYERNVRTVAKAFIKLGLERYHSVCILGFNSPEWFFSDLGAIYAGGYAVGIYTTNSPEACQYCAESSKANILVVEDAKQLEKILQIKHNLPHLKAIIQYEGTPKEKDVLSWNDLMEIGERESDDKLNEVLKKIATNECCTLVYTSGTVGNPKAVMLSHDNLTNEGRVIFNTLKLVKREHVLISYLPLSHVAAQMIDIYAGMTAVATLYFADKDALKGSLIDTLLAARPTLFLGVPRVWEKIYEKLQLVARNNGYIKTWISSWAKAQALYYHTNKMNGVDVKSWGYLVAKWLIFSKVKAALGLDRCNMCFSGAAPLSDDIKQYFLSLDMPILEAYGMSESSGAHTLATHDTFRIGSVGKHLLEYETTIYNKDKFGEGEICMRGRQVFMGYLNEPEKTEETLDSDGWLHTGDLGTMDSNELLYVTGRIKELIITAGGENIPPVQIEQQLLAELPALSYAVLIGDNRKYLTILVTLKTEMDNNTGEPKDNFNATTLKWLQSIGSTSQTVSDVLSTRDPLVYEEIDKAIKRVNAKAVSNAQKIQKFQILPHDFSVPTGELGPTLKIKRRTVHNMYKNLIEDMYK